MLASTSAPRAVARLFRARRPPQTRRTRRTSARTPGASASAAGPGPIAVTAIVGGAATTTTIPGSGGSVGSDASACVCVVAGADDEHAKPEVRQGRIFVTAVSKTKGVFLGGSRLFPGVAYPIPEGAEVTLGDGDAAVTLTAAQADGGAGTAGVDAMSKMMQMQFEATMDPEVRKAMEE